MIRFIALLFLLISITANAEDPVDAASNKLQADLAKLQADIPARKKESAVARAAVRPQITS